MDDRTYVIVMEDKTICDDLIHSTGEVALNCAMHSLGEPEAPTPLVLGWISAHVVAKLAQQRISLLSTIHRHFLEKTQGDVYGVLSGLESQSRNGTLLDSASGRKWGSPLLAAILKLFLADTRWSISRELFSRHIPVPTLKLAVIFVSPVTICQSMIKRLPDSLLYRFTISCTRP
jgi:hypothetical protein